MKLSGSFILAVKSSSDIDAGTMPFLTKFS
jgi:hypothetical protein